MGRKLKSLTGHLAFAISAAVLGSAFQHGYNTGVVNAPQTLIEQFINGTTFDRTGSGMEQGKLKLIWSVTVSIYCVGGMFGGLASALVANRLGRKGGLLLNNIFILIGAAFMTFAKMAKSYEMIIVGRFFVGINSGLNAALCPMYLNEISPAHLRGAIGSTYQLVITLSILISNVLGLSQCLGTADLWPYLLGLTVVPAVFQLCTLPFCPESPKFLLLNRGQEIRAQEALTWFRGNIEVHDEMEDMKSEGESMKSAPKVTLRELTSNTVLVWPLIISVVIMLAQQFSGINAAIFFSTEIFKSAGLSQEVAIYATIGMGIVNVIMTLISLVLVEKAGRKSLLMVGLVGLQVVTILLTISLALKDQASWLSYISIILVYSFIVLFAAGLGSIPWFLVTELFGQGARALATSIANAVNWAANTMVGVLFLVLEGLMGPYVFLVFTALLLGFSIFVYFKVPETKNKSPEEIASHFRARSYE